jgi:hypothetical protein
MTQFPFPREFRAKPNWPPELATLYEESAKSYAAAAYTASAMVSRKLLMACACDKGAEDGKTFAIYVDYIIAHIAYPDAKPALDKLRTIGNEANHHVEFVNQANANRALVIVTHMLDMIYSFTAA